MEQMKKDYKKPELEAVKMVVSQFLCDSGGTGDVEKDAREYNEEF